MQKGERLAGVSYECPASRPCDGVRLFHSTAVSVKTNFVRRSFRYAASRSHVLIVFKSQLKSFLLTGSLRASSIAARAPKVTTSTLLYYIINLNSHSTV